MDGSRRSFNPSDLLAKLALLAGTLVLILVLGEVGVRLCEPRSDRAPIYRHLDHSTRIWGLLPNRSVLRSGQPLETNSFGQRGVERTLEKPPGTFRIVGLGDSYTLGAGVPYEDTYLRLLEKRLNAAAPSDSFRAEALNFGIEGYNTLQEVAYFKEAGIPFHPDLVLLQYLFNDTEDASTAEAEARPAHSSARGHGLTHLIIGLKERSHFFAFVSPRAGALLRKIGVKRTGLVGSYVNEFADGNPGWRKSRAALLECDSLARANGARFAVIVFPALVSLRRADYPLLKYQAVVTDFCRAHGIPVFDLYPTFEGKQANRYWLSITDPHPNAAANHLIADAIYQFLEGAGLLPRFAGTARAARVGETLPAGESP